MEPNHQPLCLFFFGKPYCAMAVSAHTYTTHRIASHRIVVSCVFTYLCVFLGFSFTEAMVSSENMNAARLFREEQQRQSGILTIYTHTLLRKTGLFLLFCGFYMPRTLPRVYTSLCTKRVIHSSGTLSSNSTQQTKVAKRFLLPSLNASTVARTKSERLLQEQRKNK